MSKPTVATLAQDLRSAFERIAALEAEVAQLKAGGSRKSKPKLTLEQIAAKGKATKPGTKAWAALKAQYLAMKNRCDAQALSGEGSQQPRPSAKPV